MHHARTGVERHVIAQVNWCRALIARVKARQWVFKFELV